MGSLQQAAPIARSCDEEGRTRKEGQERDHKSLQQFSAEEGRPEEGCTPEEGQERDHKSLQQSSAEEGRSEEGRSEEGCTPEEGQERDHQSFQQSSVCAEEGSRPQKGSGWCAFHREME